VFLSTHTLDIAEELADRIGIIDHGRLLGLGTLADLRKHAAVDGNLEDLFLAITQSGGDRGEGVGDRSEPVPAREG
jgi:ABC-2 type transport system ATP-binding protein